MKNSTVWIAVIVVAIIAIGAYQYPSGKEVVERVIEKGIGAVVSPEVYDHVTLHQNYTKGGNQVATSSTATTYTLTTKEIRKDVSYVSWTVNVNTTLTTMASSSEPLSNLKTGESFELYFHNASTTAGASATFAAGTGVDLQKNEDTADLAVTGLDVVKLTFIKKANKDVILLMEEFIEAD